jgi:hypothetical protein
MLPRARESMSRGSAIIATICPMPHAPLAAPNRHAHE